MKKCILFFYLVLLPFLQNAQDFKINWGDAQKKSGLISIQKLIGGDANNYYLLFRPRKKNKLFQYDMDNQLISSSKNTFKVGKKALTAEDLISTSAGDFLVVKKFNKKKKKDNVFVVELGEGALEEKEPKELFSFTKKEKDYKARIGGMGVLLNLDTYGSALSSDSSKVLFTRIESTKVQKFQYQVYHLFVFDENMKKLWEKTFRPPVLDEDFNISKYSISKSGEVCLVATIWKGKKKKRPSWKPGYDYAVFRIDEKGEHQQIDITLDKGAPLKSVDAKINDDNSISVVGLYSKPNSEPDGANGLFIAKYDQSGAVIYQEKYPWNSEMKSKFMSKENKKNSSDVTDLEIDHLEIDEKNKQITFVIFQEQIGSSTVRLPGFSNPTAVNNYKCDKIAVVSFSLEGEMNWISSIDRNFASIEFGTSSYLYRKYEGKIYLLFNQENCYSPRLVRIDKSGEQDIDKLLDSSSNYESCFSPTFSTITRDGVVLLYGASIKKYQTGTYQLPFSMGD